MPRRTRTVKSRPIYIPSVPRETGWIESDSYDRRAWGSIAASASSIGTLVESGERLLPHFASLLADIFFGLFKYNLVWMPPDRVRQSASLNRTVLENLIVSPVFEALKNRTLLEEDKAAIAAVVLAEQVLEMVRTERLMSRRDLLELFDLQHQEDDLEARAQALSNAVEMAENAQKPQPKGEGEGEEGEQADQAALARKIEQLKEAAKRAAQVSEARLNQKARRLEETLQQINRNELKRLQAGGARLVEQIDDVARDSHDFSLEFGQSGGRLSAGERLELGRRLARNRKLGELARLVGRFKQDARAVRRKVLDRGSAETYDIESGAELGRLIPAELLAMHHPVLAADFRRRLLEGSVLQYQLRQDEQKGKGPMVVCVDCSSSMQGDKELWAKAVSLTLMDIARRQRRLFRAVLFSSGENTLKVLDLNRERRYQPELEKVLEMAEYFPGGGTDFEKPLDAAMELIEDRKLKRADIVMITDGECQVSPEWLARMRECKERLQFSIYSILVDVGSSERSTLAQFSDRLTSITRLTAENTREIFLNI